MSIGRRLFLLSAATLPLYSGPPVTFSASEAKLVEAITGCLIPADDAPGAVAVGVVFYIDRQLAGPLRRYAEVYRAALPKFDAACQERTGKAFVELESEAQTSFLQRAESETDLKLGSFFSLLLDHTMQGFYGSPEHGGNRGEASWKMLGIEDVMKGGVGSHKH